MTTNQTTQAPTANDGWSPTVRAFPWSVEPNRYAGNCECCFRNFVYINDGYYGGGTLFCSEPGMVGDVFVCEASAAGEMRAQVKERNASLNQQDAPMTAEREEKARNAEAQDAKWAAQGLKRCQRCGGAGGNSGWPGWVCYDCGGAGYLPA